MFDAVVVGSGPNGLAAAVELARRGRSVRVIEGSSDVGGGARSSELIEAGHLHDVCSSIHPLAAASPFFNDLPLERYGLEWVTPRVQVSHPLGQGRAVGLMRSLTETSAMLGDDGERYRSLMDQIVGNLDSVVSGALAPLQSAVRRPRTMVPFGLKAIRSTEAIAQRFEGAPAQALLAGLGAHSIARLDQAATGGVALVLAATAHGAGWPVARGGSQAISGALAGYLQDLGGTIETGRWINSLDELPPAHAVFLDTSPAAAAAMAGDRLALRMARKLGQWRRGPGTFKVDWILGGPIPWDDPLSAQAGTVHVGGSYDEIAASETAAVAGRPSDHPFVLVAQPSIVDDSRAPAGRHIAWGYCHVPHGWEGDATAVIEAQIERFAPGFRDLIVARHSWRTRDIAADNPNNVGGDIGGGALNLRQLLFRPRVARNPYRIGDNVYLCSSSTPPGAGVHGMCGYHAVAYSTPG